ncbi:PREDICTED: probable protein phosphatase 2C 20 [Papilio xuthus]|uniref:Probable protein phosphatase 2C 20 n=1 Tax=Papilio xuthus TaxID=66420 RepID=A0AAJ6Z8L2_PAPXU|nr:PREDICTED: probable protein phosphatase 2C 20 [Papilio xuthus]
MPPSIGVNLRVTGHCSQGGRKYMEDLFSVAYQQTEDERDLEYAFFGIYDGHGGSEAAAFAKEHLMDSIVKQRQFWSDNDEDVLKAIRNGYMLTHLNMWKELEKWPKTVTGLPSTAGTTASVAFIRRGKIYIGHVGDSAIVLGYQKDGCEEWAAKPLTSDHKPESSAEIERIQRCGGKVITKAGVPRVVWNRPRLGHKGPIKKNTPMDEIPFLAVARSLGDLWSYNPQNDEFIVSPDPDVGVLTIDPAKFRCLIFGTDGLWNMMSAEGAVALVQATERHNEAALLGAAGPPRDWLNPSKSLVDHALERWSNTRMRADNTSVVTLMLDPPGPPRATVLRSRTGAPHRTHAPHASAPHPAHPPHASAPPAAPSASVTPATPAAPATPATPAAPPNGDGDSRHVPQNGLTIMTRYSEVDKPASAPDAADKTPLPPCATLDGRFSIPSREETPRESPADTITNYGNPAESYFMARLLNRSRVVNTLSEVYEEIVNRPTSRATSEAPEAPPATALPETAGDDADQPAPDPRGDAAPDAPPANSSPASSARPDPDGGIQINEVSSSSPTDAPRPRGRKPRADARRDVVPNDRVLRSHPHHEPDAPGRPHTRQTRGKNLERVVILTRRPTPKSERRDHSPAVEARGVGRRAPDCAEEEARRTRSQLASGNCARAPGPARRAAAARGAHYKENFRPSCSGAGRRGAALDTIVQRVID